jgi:hypothetical protein
MVLYQLVSTVPIKWANWLTGLGNTGYYGSTLAGASWKVTYLYPVVLAILEILVLELIGWIYVWSTTGAKKK